MMYTPLENGQMIYRIKGYKTDLKVEYFILSNVRNRQIQIDLDNVSNCDSLMGWGEVQ